MWLKRRKNPPKHDGSTTTSYTLEWLEFGQRRFMSLGRHATAAYARQARADKERELNSPEGRQSLEPTLWKDFRKKYLDTVYPGHDLPSKERKEASASWGKSHNTMRAERLALDNFERLVLHAPGRASTWCHEITSADREKFASERLKEVGSAESVDADLRNLRTGLPPVFWSTRNESTGQVRPLMQLLSLTVGGPLCPWEIAGTPAWVKIDN